MVAQLEAEGSAHFTWRVGKKSLVSYHSYMNFNWDPAKAPQICASTASHFMKQARYFSTHWLSLMQIQTIQSASTVS
jgi:hypothetical protein